MRWFERAKEGDKIVLVNDEWPPVAALAVSMGVSLPVKEVVYTIRQIGKSLDGGWLLRLEEIVNPHVSIPHSLPGEPTFGASRFRPVQPRQTDISVFTRLLNTTPADLVEA